MRRQDWLFPPLIGIVRCTDFIKNRTGVAIRIAIGRSLGFSSGNRRESCLRMIAFPPPLSSAFAPLCSPIIERMSASGISQEAIINLAISEETEVIISPT